MSALAVGVPTAVVLGGSDADPDRKPDQTVATDPAPPGRTLPAGFHYESWHGVTIEVPDDWRYGAISQWCVGSGELSPPVIERPGPSTLVGCLPHENGYGVRFQEIDNTEDFYWPLAKQGSSWPADAWVGAHGLGGVLVEISLPDINLAQQILDSAQINAALDPNGCPIDDKSDPVVPGDAMSVCTYDGAGQLVNSELLTGSQVQDAEAALDSTESAGNPACTDVSSKDVVQTVRLASIALDATLIEDPNCLQLTVHGEGRTVTEDVLYWALSPGSGGSFPNDAPLPSEHRKR